MYTMCIKESAIERVQQRERERKEGSLERSNHDDLPFSQMNRWFKCPILFGKFSVVQRSSFFRDILRDVLSRHSRRICDVLRASSSKVSSVVWYLPTTYLLPTYYLPTQLASVSLKRQFRIVPNSFPASFRDRRRDTLTRRPDGNRSFRKFQSSN